METHSEQAACDRLTRQTSAGLRSLLILGAGLFAMGTIAAWEGLREPLLGWVLRPSGSDLEGSLEPGLMRGLGVGLLAPTLLGGFLVAYLFRLQGRLGRLREAVLAQSEAERFRLEGLLRDLPIPLFSLDREGRLTSVNHCFTSFIGCSAKALTGRSLRELLPENERDQVFDWDDPLLENEAHLYTHEATLLNHYGELRKVSIHVTDCGEEADAQSRRLGVIVDDTEGVNAFHAMENALDLMTKVTSQVPGVVFEWKRQSDGSFCFPWVSVGLQRIFEVSPLDVEDDAEVVFGRIHPDDQACFRAALDRSAQELEPWKEEFRICRSDGEERWVIGNAAPEQDVDGGILWHGFIADITEFKMIEEQLRLAKSEADRASRAKTAFLAAMSHEIRTPMNGVIGMTSLLAQTEMTTEQASFVNTIRQSGDALLVVINDILDFSKIESGRLELESTPYDIAECVEGVIDILSPQASRKGLHMAYYVDPRVPARLRGDVTRIRQILVNLVGNAVKFTSEGEVFIELDTVEEAGDAYLRVAVQDTGPGIPESRRDRLFKPFSQVDSATNRIYGGTGLGLAISKRLTELMQGRLTCESVEGDGSNFTLHLPLSDNVLAGGETRYRDEKGILAGKRLLIVDSVARNRAIVERYAQSWGMSCVSAASLSVASEAMKSGPAFDLLLVDQILVEAADEERGAWDLDRQTTFAQCPAILLGAGVRAPGGPWQGYLSKPLKATPLCQILCRSLSGSSARPPSETRAPLAPASEDDAAGSDPLRILIVEDNKVNQKVARMIIAKLGYESDLAGNGKEAVEAVAASDYDFILMDVQMPVMDGYEATRVIRQQVEHAHIPWIVALTAHATTADRVESMDKGMNDYLSKPVKIEDLRAALGRFRNCRNETAGATSPEAG